MASSSELWAVTSYFNPQRYRRRLVNYRIFREHLRLPLVTAELSFGNEFELGEGDADMLVQVREGDIMWQKERLLNLAIAALPPSCRKVVWLDCDLLFERDDWPMHVAKALDVAPIVHPFSRVFHLQRDADHTKPDPNAAIFHQLSIAHAAGGSWLERLQGSRERTPEASANGFAWAARRELLEKHGLFDACIVGGGDSANTCALYGCFDELLERHCLNDRQFAYYLAWARPFHEAVRGESACIDGAIYHLWHGDLRNRHAMQRHQNFRPFEFDPEIDLALAPGGAWRWNSDKPSMHQYVRNYFAARKEDE